MKDRPRVRIRSLRVAKLAATGPPPPQPALRAGWGPRPVRAVRTPRQVLAFVRKHGVVLESGRGPVPSLADAIAGKPIRGSWWSHPESGLIFKLTRAVRDSDQVLVCRVVGGKITFVHRRLWPALVHMSHRFPKASLARISEVHMDSGRHVVRAAPFPTWVPAAVRSAAKQLSEAAALKALGPWVP